jgi:hypothetical protein
MSYEPPRREAAVSKKAVEKSKTEKAVLATAQDCGGFGMQDAGPKAQLCRAHYEHFGASTAPKGAVAIALQWRDCRGAKRPVEGHAEAIAQCAASYTGRYLKETLGRG